MSGWENSSAWYDRLVGDEGHYYHVHVVLPGVLRLLQLKAGQRLVDVACGQGVLAKALRPEIDYVGLDAAPSLIKAAKKAQPKREFLVQDVSKPWKVEGTFQAGACILALQNIEHAKEMLLEAGRHIEGRFVIVLNHPYYRIPRQSMWGMDNKLQYRRVNRYMTPMAIPIQNQGETTVSYHTSLSTLTQWAKEAGFVIEVIEEWCSPKKSTGHYAAAENRAREEFPLFMTLVLSKEKLNLRPIA